MDHYSKFYFLFILYIIEYMKILIATGIYPPEIGGPATYSKLLYDTLPSHDMEVEILPYRIVKNVPKIFRHFWYFLYVLKKSKGVDIIFAQDPMSVGLPAALAVGVLRKKFALKIVGDYAWEQGKQRFGVEGSLDDFVKKGKRYVLQVWLMRYLQKKVADMADSIVVPSKYLKKIVTAWGVDEQKINVVYNAFESPKSKQTKEVAQKELSISSPIILSVGRLVPWKGFDTLIEIIPHVRETIPEAKLIIVGEGTQRKRLEALVQEKKLGHCIFFTGAISHEKVLAYIKAADLFVLNTQYEGFSHLLLEVMSLGTPIVTTSVGGNVEIIEHKKDGVLVEYNDKKALYTEAVRILSDRENTEEMVKNASVKVLDYSTDSMIQGIIRVLSSLNDKNNAHN